MSRSSLLAAAVIAGSVAVPHVNVHTDCRAAVGAPVTVPADVPARLQDLRETPVPRTAQRALRP
jgi:hypothetical protein